MPDLGLRPFPSARLEGRICYYAARYGNSQTQWLITSGGYCDGAILEFDGRNARGKRVGYAFLEIANKYCPVTHRPGSTRNCSGAFRRLRVFRLRATMAGFSPPAHAAARVCEGGLFLPHINLRSFGQ